MLVIIQMTPRAERGTGALTIAVDGHWNSRIAGNVGSSGSGRRLTNAMCSSTQACSSFDHLAGRRMPSSWRNDRLDGDRVFEMAVLLRPELAVDRAALEQHAVRGDVDDAARDPGP